MHAKKILDDGVYCDIIKIGGLVRNKEIFVKRRQRLLGPNGSTLKAIELLTQCYVLVQGQTVSAIGDVKGLKMIRRIVVDCIKNVHPVYHIKELMIKKELANNDNMKNEIWDQFLPKFSKRTNNKKKTKKPQQEKKEKNIFPAPPTPRKEDILMETGEYFTSTAEKKDRQKKKEDAKREAKRVEKKAEKRKQLIAPPIKKRKNA
eukprot:GHVO01068971.1.p1 GENE.GHVO01068971.1~~GHVO01068971.1.p1  ORF type:complete len:204 (+),score=57.71 GHVO01068971.1:143-754(+)